MRNFLLLSSLLCVGELVHGSPTASNNSSIVSVPYQYTYLLPNGFVGNTNYTFVNGTHTNNSQINSVLDLAKKAPIISYDPSFLDIVGSNPVIKEVATEKTDFAYEMGVWVPERNEVWFTSAVEQGMIYPATLRALNLGTGAVNVVNVTNGPLINPNGGYYFQGKVYIATYPNNASYSGGVVSVDVKTLKLETVVNSYFGLRFNGIDDIAWGTRGNRSYMYFTDLDYGYLAYNNLPPLQLPANIWRWDPQEKVVMPVVTRNEINPNGVRVSPDSKILYATDSTAVYMAGGAYSPASGPADALWLGPYIYAWDLNADMVPVNRRVVGLVREGIADGLHIDDFGNIYTGEYEGIVVRNPMGKVIGIFNAQYFQYQGDTLLSGVHMANFALAGDTIVFEALTKLYTIKLAKTIVSRNSSIVN